MIFVWNETGEARELEVGKSALGLTIRGVRPDTVVLTEKELETIQRDFDFAEEYLARLTIALISRSPAKVIIAHGV